MSSKSPSHKYEENYAVLEKITESLNKDEVGIDDLVEKTREALNAARTCMEILNKQKGEFTKLETEFSQLLQPSVGTPASEPQESSTPSVQAESLQDEEFDAATEDQDEIGGDDPF